MSAKCKLLLSNGQELVEDENDVGWWRKTIGFCTTNNLKISKFFVNDVEWTQLATGYFMLFTVTCNSMGQQSAAKGYGYYQKNIKKARIMWYYESGGSIAEVRRPADEFIPEIVIDRTNV